MAAWEFSGEANLVPGYIAEEAAVWHEALARQMLDADGGRHPIFTHCQKWQQGHPLWALDGPGGIDCVQGNGYIRPPNRSTDHCLNFANYLSEVQHYRKPVLVAEYGGRSEQGAPDADYLTVQFHSGLWASSGHPFAGLALPWWWNFTEGAGLYSHYAPLSEVVREVDRLAHDWRPGELRVDDGTGTGADQVRASAYIAPGRALIWVHHRDIFTRWRSLPAVKNLPWPITGISRLRCWHTHGGGLVCDRRLLPGSPDLDLPTVDKDLGVLITPWQRP